MSCPVCGHGHVFIRYTIGAYSLKCCRRCGHAVTDPMPDTAELAALYDQKYFSTHYEDVAPGDPGFAKHICREDHRVRFVKKYKTQGQLLDVGCGRGYFLYACRKRFAPVGFDISPANKDFISRKLDMEFVDNPGEISQRRFDVITFWHSFEHFPDPERQLAFFIDVLDHNGILILDVPNHDSIDAFMEGEDWPGWDLPFHCHHFTPTSLALLIGRHGLEVIGQKTYHCGYIKKRLAENPITRPFARPIAKLFPGSSILFACRKKEQR